MTPELCRTPSKRRWCGFHAKEDEQKQQKQNTKEGEEEGEVEKCSATFLFFPVSVGSTETPVRGVQRSECCTEMRDFIMSNFGPATSTRENIVQIDFHDRNDGDC